MNNYWRGVVYSLAAAVFWAVMSPIAKYLAAGGINLLSAMAFRAFFVAAVLGPWLLISKGKEVFFPKPSILKFYFISGSLSVACAGGGFLMSLEYLSVAEALSLHYTFPLVAMLGSLYVTHEKPDRRQVAAGFMIVFGVYCGMVGGKPLSGMSLPGVLWGLLAVFGISGQALIGRRISKTEKIDSIVMLFFTHTFGFFILLLGKSVFIGWADIANFTPFLFSILLLQAISGSLIAYGLFYSALKYIPAATVSLLCTLEMVLAVALTAVTLGTVPTLREVVGCAVIISAIVISTIKKK